MQFRILLLVAAVLAIVPARPLAVDGPGGQASAQQVTRSVTAMATFAPRTSVQVSSEVLHFHVTDASIPAVAAVDFTAGARTRHGGEVLLMAQLTVPERLTPAGVQTLAVVAGTEGTIAGPVALDAPAIVARWTGGGLRNGRLTFRLQAAPGQYEIPVRFFLVLS